MLLRKSANFYVSMSIYQSNPQQQPDTDFEPGTIAHLVEGNTGRLLDPRRTPVTIVAIEVATGMFTVRLDDFEDAGGLWHMPLEHADRFQLARGSAVATPAQQNSYQQAIARFDQPLRIEIDAGHAAATNVHLDAMRDEAAAWLSVHSTFLTSRAALPDPPTRDGDRRLQDDLQRYMDAHDLLEMESAVAEQYVRNPHSGEMVKGHRIVLAELGLVAYDGTIVRDPNLFEGRWSRKRRAEHILHRLAFVRAVLSALGIEAITLYRGCYSSTGAIDPLRNVSFVSATTSIDVARSHFESDPTTNAVLMRQHVPIERVFMTYYETAEMNQHFREAEVVLLHETGNPMY